MENKLYFNDGWLFAPEFSKEMVEPSYKGSFETIRLPHTVAVTPFNNFSVSRYEKVSLYRKEFITDPSWNGKKVLITFEGAAHQSEVFINGTSVCVHPCGYTAFTVDITDYLKPSSEKNVLAVKLDSRESVDQPPFGFVIDYMTYGGIYRDVYIEIKNPVYIEDVFVKTNKNHFETEITLSGECHSGYSIHQKVVSAGSDGTVCAEIHAGVSSSKLLTEAGAQPVVAWDIDNPALYNLTTELLDGSGSIVDSKTVRFGFRDVRYDSTGFYLNGKKIKIRGLNRHQSYPYVGYAMPKNMQREDADILKFELGLNEVRTSHYPQSQYFIDRCDEIGLLVFTEIPGWQHIGGAEWKNIAVQNVHDMVVQYRNHPSIFLWGVRINESMDDDEFYERTNKVAHELDSTRPTGGVRCIKHSHLLEDVYTYNDFVHFGTNEGLSQKKNVTDTDKGYMVTEYNGHMYPTKMFDDEIHRTEHAVRHAKVLDASASMENLSGTSGWCAFDYNTHRDFGSGDKICYHGVMDMFRNPKIAAYVYQSQGEPSVTGDVLFVNSSLDIGEYPAGAIGDIWIYTNADSVKFYENGVFIKEYSKKDSPFKSLAHGPILIDDFIGNRLIDEDKISEEASRNVKDFLMILRRYAGNFERLSAKEKTLAQKIEQSYKLDEQKLRSLFGKYVAGWGGSIIEHKFEAIRDGKVVKTLVRVPSEEVCIKAIVLRDTLIEDNSYDVASVRFAAVDQNENIQPYCQESVTLKTEGDIELIGPSAVSLKGGCAGTYVKSVGKSGSGNLILEDWMGNSLKIPFTVIKN
ncbi:MAG: glycoside hydrolase family 2 protein [Treponema sp.]|nr:glycoside hydrolase family 2 protein [Treponema sp.]